jgi:hypothetical protein
MIKPGNIAMFCYDNETRKDTLFLVLDIHQSEWSNKKTCKTLDLKTMTEKVFYCDDLLTI